MDGDPRLRRVGWRRIRLERLLRKIRALELPEWRQLPRQACGRCGSVRWVVLYRHETPYRHEERLCTECGETFITGSDALDHEERQRTTAVV